MTKMAAIKKPRGFGKEKSTIVVEKLEDAVEIVKLPPIFTPDSKFACVVSGRQIRIFSVETGEKIYSLTGHPSNVVGIAMKDSNVLVSCDETGDLFQWDVQTGKKLEEQKIKPINWQDKFHSFLSPGHNMYLVTVSILSPILRQRILEHVDVWLLDPQMKPKKLFGVVKNTPTAIACGCNGNGMLIVAAIKDDSVVVKDLSSGASKLHMTDERTFTCVALHPTEVIMATGDISGRILIWYNFIQSTKPLKTAYHWHASAVNSVCFSHDGNYFISGGAEKTLVKWRLGTNHKTFLPRMGSVIKYVTYAPDNACIATSHTDNAIRLINGINKITHAIMGLIKHDPIRGIEGKESLMPAGMLWDPRSHGIFLNGQAGHMQLFDLEHNSVIFNLDIANRNILTNQGNQVIGNSEVMRAALSSDGLWLATLESWSNCNFGFKDILLKFWQFNATVNNFELNTNVTVPHKDIVTAIAFQPGLLGRESPTLVSIGFDGKFKIWRLVDDTDIYRKKDAWTCDIAGDFRNLMPTAVSFSEDGSLLAIAFEDTVTLWDPFTSELKITLAHALVDQPIKFMEFGRDQCFRYLVCATEFSIFTWDVITHGLIWKVGNLYEPIISLVADPKSMYMAIVLQYSEVFVFAPSSSEPIYKHPRAFDTPAISAVFVPRSNPLDAGPDWLTNSRLILADSHQELHCMDDQCANGLNRKIKSGVSHMDRLPWTPFAAMKAQHQIDATKKLTPIVHDTKGILGYESVQTLIETPSSTLPSMSRICSSFLCSLMKLHDESLASSSNSSLEPMSIATHGANGVAKPTEEKTSGPLKPALPKSVINDDFLWLFRDVEK